MADYPASARERAMKVEEVILRALSKQITFWQAAHIARVSPRHLRRLYERYRRHGFDGLYDRRKGRPSPKRVPWAVADDRDAAAYRRQHAPLARRRAVARPAGGSG